MNTRNSCYTYFMIVGNFNPDDISALLNLTPEESWKIGDLQRNSTTKYEFANWTIGKCAEYDVYVENQMRKTISILLDKIATLNQIREENDVEFFLEIVPSIYVDDINPCLAPPLDVIDFCHATRTQIDIDMYLFDSENKQATPDRH